MWIKNNTIKQSNNVDRKSIDRVPMSAYRISNNRDYGKEITLGDIVTYIEKNKIIMDMTKTEFLKVGDINTEKQIEILENNKICYLVNLPTNLGAIFGSGEANPWSGSSLSRVGSIHHVSAPSDADISYASSIISVIFDDYATLNEIEQIEIVETFIRRIHKESREKFKEFGYEKFGWAIKDFVNNVNNFTMGKDLARYISDYLYINIFVLDIENDGLIYIGEKHFIKYKKNVFIMKVGENSYEPIIAPDMKYFDHYTPIVKKLINSRFLVERLDCDFTNEKEEFDFILGQEDLNKYLSEPEKNEPVIDKTSHISTPIGRWATVGMIGAHNNKILIPSKMESMVTKEIDPDVESGDLNGFGEHVDYTCENQNHDDQNHDDQNHDNQNHNIRDDKSRENRTSDKFIQGNTNLENNAPEITTKTKSLKNKSVKDKDVAPIIKKTAKRNTKKETQSKYKASSLIAYTAAQLRILATDNNIVITYIKNGKESNKTRPMLISDLCALEN